MQAASETAIDIVRKEKPLVHEVCPSCGAKISVGSRALTKKIRCPHCRLVVVLSAKPEPGEAKEGAQHSAPPAADEGVTSPVVAEYPPDFIADVIDHGKPALDEKERKALLRQLGTDGRPRVTLSVPGNEPEPLLLAHALRKIYREAGWEVTVDSPMKAEGRQEGGLVLYTEPWPFPREVTKSCMALTAAGLQFTSRIEPGQRERVVLVIGRDLGGMRRERKDASEPAAEVGLHPVFEEFRETDRDEEEWLNRVREAGAEARPDGLVSRGLRMAEALATHLLEGGGKKELALLRDLGVLLSDVRNLDARADETGTAPEALTAGLARRCARMALALLQYCPALKPEAKALIPALRFADAVLARPPLTEDAEAQHEFEAFLAEAAREGAAELRRGIATEVRPWHWFRNAERRALFEDLVQQGAHDAGVTEAALAMLAHWPAEERERMYRRLLDRECQGAELAEQFGRLLGVESMLVATVDGEQKRMAAAEIAAEWMEKPAVFPFLTAPQMRREFLRAFAIGLTEGAARVSELKEPAEDFSRWCHRAWQELDAPEGEREPRAVMVFVARRMATLCRKCPDPEVARYWWNCLSGLSMAVIQRGHRRDIFSLFAGIRDGGAALLATVEELFELIGAYLERIEHGLHDRLHHEKGAHYEDLDWGDVADCIADVLLALLADGRLDDVEMMRKARRFLLQLATERGGSCKAAGCLPRFELKENGKPDEDDGVAAA